jgi:hypothetical protein
MTKMIKAPKPKKVKLNRRDVPKANFRSGVRLLGTDILTNDALKAKLLAKRKRAEK